MASPKPEVLDEIVDTHRFRLIRKIADGGMGSIYQAVLYGAMGFEKTVAIKTIHERLSSNPDFLEMFIGEARLTADLVHQNICQVYQLGRVGERFYIAMEYVAGLDLSEFIARHVDLGRFTLPEMAAFIVSRICRGLEYAHAKRDREGQPLGVVHRDVSPRNILISRDGEVKLTDFGVAKARAIMRERGGQRLLGKAHYMSPEQALMLETDPRSDIFSLGAVLFELLTNRKLFAASTLRSTLRKVVSMPIPPLRKLQHDVPEDLERIALRALERARERRYPSAGDMGYELEYAIYRNGYGPTILALENYLRELVPFLYSDEVDASASQVPCDPDSPTSA